jgi:cell filamentation protein
MSPFPNDPHCYPGTDILRNLIGTLDRKVLETFEADAVAVNIIGLRRNPIKGPFDINRLKETHRRIFGNIFPWAGEFRHGIDMMTKERSGFVVTYGPSENVPTALAGTFAALQAEKVLRGLDSGRFAARLAFFYSEFDAIHAFREGNSRTLRAFTSDLAESAGHRLNWSMTAMGTANGADARQRLYHARDLAVMRGDTSELAEIISAGLDIR